jgi:cytochrome c-type biogenesis protein CcmH/NrfF
MSKQGSMTLTYRALALATVLVTVLTVVLVACSGDTQVPATTVPSQAGTIDAAKLLDARCSACHSASVVSKQGMSAAEWDRTVSTMVQRGANLSADEKEALVAYLAANYGK